MRRKGMKRSVHIEKKKRITLAAICVALAAVCISAFPLPQRAYADNPVAGTINDGPVRVRNAPVNGEQVGLLYPGTVVSVIGEATGTDGYIWYQIQAPYNGVTITGYTRSDYITLQTAQPPAESGGSGVPGVVANTSLGVYVRSGAGTSYSALTKVYQGQPVTVLGQAQGGGLNWYQVTLSVGGTAYQGYICADYVAVDGEVPGGGSSGAVTPVPDEAYLASLLAAGFPESYCNSLLALHQKYPEWQFVPVQTGLDWNTVIANESVTGRNLIEASANDARKSTDPASYNWAANTWYGFDGPGWVGASSQYIAYCMDPRNFLNENYIFQFETLEYAPYQTADGVRNILSNTFMAGNYTDTDGSVRGYADTFAEIGANLGVSPYHLAARCKQEQGVKGTSPLISGTYAGYEGYYNYFNVRAYTTSSASAAQNGLAYAKQQGWNSIYRAIAGGSAVVADNYVKKGQNTIYFEKFNVVYTNSLYNHQYMTNVQAAMSEGSNMGKAHLDRNQAFVFRIPVYTGMPESPVSFADTGNPNNWLSSLTVNGYSLTPGFSGTTTAYSVVVPESTASVSVAATAVAGTSKITGTGNYSLNYGNNTINVTCIAQSGASKNYTITVARQQPAGSGNTIAVADGASITSVYPVGAYVTGISPGSSADSVLSGIVPQNCTVSILTAGGEQNTGTVGTGNLLTVTAGGAVAKQVEVVIYGDINGDGRISNADIVLMQKHILGIQTQSGASLAALDINRDGSVTNRDLVLLQKHVLGISTISQQ